MFDLLLIGSHLFAAALGAHYGVFGLLLRLLVWIASFLAAYWLRFASFGGFGLGSHFGAHSEFLSILLFSVMLSLLLFFNGKIADMCARILESISSVVVSKALGALLCVSAWTLGMALLMTINTVYSHDIVTESVLAHYWRDAGEWLFANGQLFTNMIPTEPSDSIDEIERLLNGR